MFNLSANINTSTGGISNTELNQSIELHRQAMIGRLITCIVHEINNPMQAIQGSAVLALENITDTTEVFDYLNLIQRESARVLKLTSLLRSIYASQSAETDYIDLNELVQHLLPLLKDDLNRQEIQLDIHSRSTPVCIRAVQDQVQLALLETILSFNQFLSAHACKRYSLVIAKNANAATLEFNLGQAASALGVVDESDLEALSSDLSFAFTLFTRQHGKIELLSHEQLMMRVEFPQNAGPGTDRE